MRCTTVMAKQLIDTYAAELPSTVQQAVHQSTATTTAKRYQLLGDDYADADSLRKLAGAIRQHALEHLDTYLEQAEEDQKVMTHSKVQLLLSLFVAIMTNQLQHLTLRHFIHRL